MSAAALDSPRPTVLRAFGVLMAFVRRDWAIAWSYRLPFAMGAVQGLIGVVFVYFLGRLVGRRIEVAGLAAHGGYFAYAVVGTTLLSFFGVTLTAFAQRLRSDQTAGTLEVLLTMPPRPALTLLGSASYQVLYSMMASVLTVCVAVAMGLRFHTSALALLVTLAALAASLALFCAVGIAFAAFVLVFKRGETLCALGTSALMLIGGVYYPLSLLPHVLAVVAQAIPFTWALEVLRSCLLSDQLPMARLAELTFSAALTVALALRLFSAALDRSRRAGTLGQY